MSNETGIYLLETELENSRLRSEVDRLNEEIERLKEKNEELMSLYTSERYVKEDYKSRNNEAIEYMERYMFSQKENYDYIHLLGILKGSDKE